MDNSALISVKDQLQAKLLEFGTLVSELGRMQNTQPTALQDKFSDPSSWRPDVPAAILSGQAPRMDGILEEASSPGGTLQYVYTRVPVLYFKLTRLGHVAITQFVYPTTAILLPTLVHRPSFILTMRIL
jgi:hypothetical protein